MMQLTEALNITASVLFQAVRAEHQSFIQSFTNKDQRSLTSTHLLYQKKPKIVLKRSTY
jgi:hypothetical protein